MIHKMHKVKRAKSSEGAARLLTKSMSLDISVEGKNLRCFLCSSATVSFPDVKCPDLLQSYLGTTESWVSFYPC